MSANDSIFQLLCDREDWPGILESRLEELKGQQDQAHCGDSAASLALGFEHCVPNRLGAIASFVLSFRCDATRVDALARARRLALELGDFSTCARLAQLQYRHDKDPRLLAFEGDSWLDAGDPDRAIKPLTKAANQLPDVPEIAAALRTARREWSNVREEMRRLADFARNTDSAPQAADALVQLSRLFRMLGDSADRREQCLLAAFRRSPENLTAMCLLQEDLETLGNPDAFLEICELRIASRKGPLATVDELRRLGTRLFHTEEFRSIAIRTLMRCLSMAYKSELVSIPGHIATLSLLREHMSQAQLESEFLELINRGLALALPKLDILYLSLTGLEVARSSKAHGGAAAHYARLAHELAPNNPAVLAAEQAGLLSPGGDTAFLDEVTYQAADVFSADDMGLQEELAAMAEEASGPLPAPKLGVRPTSDAPLDLGFAPEAVAAAVEADRVESKRAEEEAERLHQQQDLLREQMQKAEGGGGVQIVTLPSAMQETEPVGEDSAIEELPMEELEELSEDDLVEGELTEEDLVADKARMLEEFRARIEGEMQKVKDAERRRVAARRARISQEIKLQRERLRQAEQDEGELVRDAPSSEEPLKPQSLGRVSLIPASALTALKAAAAKKRHPDAVKRASRYPAPIAIEFNYGSAERRAITRDLSASGAFLMIGLDIPVGTVLQLRLLLPIEAHSLRSETVELEAKIVRAADNGFGVQFTSPPEGLEARLQELMGDY